MNKVRKVLNESAREKYRNDLEEISKAVKDRLRLHVQYEKDQGDLKQAVVYTSLGEIRFLVNLGYVSLGGKRFKIPSELEDMVNELEIMSKRRDR